MSRLRNSAGGPSGGELDARARVLAGGAVHVLVADARGADLQARAGRTLVEGEEQVAIGLAQGRDDLRRVQAAGGMPRHRAADLLLLRAHAQGRVVATQHRVLDRVVVLRVGEPRRRRCRGDDGRNVVDRVVDGDGGTGAHGERDGGQHGHQGYELQFHGLLLCVEGFRKPLHKLHASCYHP